MSRHPDHSHHRPHVEQMKPPLSRIVQNKWSTSCSCGWRRRSRDWHTAMVRALSHAEGIQ